MAAGIDIPTDPGWVDDVLLAGPDGPGLPGSGRPGGPALTAPLVAERQEALAAAGLRAGGSVALCLPPSLAFIANLLAAWRLGAQASLLDHRLTHTEVDRALDRLAPQVLVEAASKSSGGALRASQDVTRAVARPDGPAGGDAARADPAQLRLDRPVEVIARTADDLVSELERYARLPRRPAPAASASCCWPRWCTCSVWSAACCTAFTPASELVLPERLTADGDPGRVAAGPAPTTRARRALPRRAAGRRRRTAGAARSSSG